MRRATRSRRRKSCANRAGFVVRLLLGLGIGLAAAGANAQQPEPTPPPYPYPYPYPNAYPYPYPYPYPPQPVVPPSYQAPPAYLPPPPAAPPKRHFDPYPRRTRGGFPLRGYVGVGGFGALVLDGGRSLGLGHGGGVSFFGGLDLGRFFAVELGYAMSFHGTDRIDCSPYRCESEDTSLHVTSVDLRLRLPTGTRFVPFIQGGGFASMLRRDIAYVHTYHGVYYGEYYDAVGGGASAGAGFDVWLAPWGSLGARAIYRAVFLEEDLPPFRDDVLHLLAIEGSFVARF